jgi:uncharacterized protein YxeA
MQDNKWKAKCCKRKASIMETRVVQQRALQGQGKPRILYLHQIKSFISDNKIHINKEMENKTNIDMYNKDRQSKQLKFTVTQKYRINRCLFHSYRPTLKITKHFMRLNVKKLISASGTIVAQQLQRH